MDSCRLEMGQSALDLDQSWQDGVRSIICAVSKGSGFASGLDKDAKLHSRLRDVVGTYLASSKANLLNVKKGYY